MEINPYDEHGGPSEKFIKHKKWFLEQRKINPKFRAFPRETKSKNK